MDCGNEIFISDGEQWSFENNVSLHFNDHVRLSVPLYEEGHDLICYISDFFMTDEATFYEIGSSTGTLINKIQKRHSKKKSVRFIGVEPVKDMIIESRKQCDKQVEFIQEAIENVKLEKCELVVSYYCLQFVDLSKRSYVFKNIYDSLVQGGGLIVFEKELLDNSLVEKIVSSSYMKFKVNNGFTPEEVLAKQFSLEGVMQNNTHTVNGNMLRKAGFKTVEIIMRYGEFCGYLCIK